MSLPTGAVSMVSNSSDPKRKGGAHKIPWNPQNNLPSPRQGMRVPVQLSEPRYLQTRFKKYRGKIPLISVDPYNIKEL